VTRTSHCGRASAPFDPEATGRLVESRALVRCVVMRADDPPADGRRLPPAAAAVPAGARRGARAGTADHAPSCATSTWRRCWRAAAGLLAEQPAPSGRPRSGPWRASSPTLDGPAMAYAAPQPPRPSCRCHRAACGADAGQVTSRRPSRGWVVRWRPRPSIEDVVRALPRRVRPASPGRPGDVVAPHRVPRGPRGHGASPADVARRSRAASCSTCPTRRSPIPTRRHRCGSCPSTTTPCCRTPNRSRLHARRPRRAGHGRPGARHRARRRLDQRHVVDGRPTTAGRR
jgi:hypothetical protein